MRSLNISIINLVSNCEYFQNDVQPMIMTPASFILSIAGILLILTLGTNFSEILRQMQTFSFKKMYLKISTGKWRPTCLDLNVFHWPSMIPRHLCCAHNVFQMTNKSRRSLNVSYMTEVSLLAHICVTRPQWVRAKFSLLTNTLLMPMRAYFVKYHSQTIETRSYKYTVDRITGLCG